jgi:isopentenyl-diphosphate delta-isomerase type 1
LANNDYVILVDPEDSSIGIEDKLVAHQQGLLHRAFSVCLLRKQEGILHILLQQRAQGKYHSGGLWTNTCCSHPRLNETLQEAAERRLFEEMGLLVKLEPIGRFIYQAKLDNGLIEHELDHVLVGYLINETINPNPAEVMDYHWVPLRSLPQAITAHPEQYTAWLEEVINIVIAYVAAE